MNDGLLTIIFIALVCLLLWRHRRKVQIQGAFPLLYVVLMRTGIGLKSMSRIANRFPRLFNTVYTLGIGVGFAGMALILVELVRVTVKLFQGGASGVVPVLPIEAKGVFYVPFLYWIISIFVIALVHELSHGVAARTFKVPVRSSGIAFLCAVLPIIPAAFVEPDEAYLQKQGIKKQLGIFAAGALANIVFGILFLLFALGTAWAVQDIVHAQGVRVTSVIENSPASDAGLPEGIRITGVNGQEVTDTKDLMEILESSKPNQEWAITTNETSYPFALGAREDDPGKAYMGLNLQDSVLVTPQNAIDHIAIWFLGLFRWLFALNIGIALFNLLPIGPLDGGRMLKLVLDHWQRPKLWRFVSAAAFLLVIGNIAAGFI
ncbi:hypothetical protein CMO91_03945 [Candidatus Woesearchaeota archaeon]|nr:hypothetical protein [Candidatus Woesearchaeota archaeon]